MIEPAGRAPQNWRLRRRLGSVFAVVGAVIAASVAVAAVASVSFVRRGNDNIYRWQPAAATSQRLLADLVNQETGVRGYALSGRIESLEPYTQYRTQQVKDSAELADLITGDTELQRLQRAVVAAADDWRLQVVEPLIAVVRRGARPSVSTLEVGKSRFDLIRTRSAALTERLAARARASRDARVADGSYALASFGVLLILVLISGVVLWRGMERWVLRPIGRLGAQTREISSGPFHKQVVADGPLEFIELGHDVETMRRQIATQLDAAERAQEDLRARSAELARSNDDLQQFAYVASHDMSEPLRKVANFCQLLERQYGPELDDRARQYIHFAVDGAKRMQALITDLLALSRVGRSTEAFETIDLDRKLDQALAGLSERITESGARIERLTPLPTVDGDRALLISLFENLVGNAIKYRRPDVAPLVRISAELDEAAHVWTFTIGDNGIGIDPAYAERIFAVFQRLHLRDQYGGTGIGLALCRKIVEFHRGHIWLADVESDVGAQFRFTLPESRARAEPRD